MPSDVRPARAEPRLDAEAETLQQTTGQSRQALPGYSCTLDNKKGCCIRMQQPFNVWSRGGVKTGHFISSWSAGFQPFFSAK